MIVPGAVEGSDWDAHNAWRILEEHGVAPAEAERARFPKLKPSTRSIPLRLPQSLLDEFKVAADKRDVPYQSLIEIRLAERLATERS